MLELTEPAKVELEGVQLLGEDLTTVEKSLDRRGMDLEPDHLGARIPSVSVALYAPSGVVEGVQLGSD
jgi:hypothetical protein